MVGATNGFIRWPFVVEGLFWRSRALLAFFMQWGVYSYVTERILTTFRILNTIDFTEVAVPWRRFAVTGFVVGVGGSLLTIRRFLKV
jgi:cell division transport system permease protein